MKPPINSFRGQYRWLSNFYPVNIQYGVLTFPSVEAFYMAMKTTDPEIREQFTKLTNPAEAKKLGRTIKLRDDWEQIKLHAMLFGLRRKFRDPKLAKLLLDTGDAHLEEGNTWGDRFWGVCDGRGENHLGKLLMKVRQELRANT